MISSVGISKKGTAKLPRSCRVFARGDGMTWQGCVKMHGVWWLSRARGLRMGYFMGSHEKTTQKLSKNQCVDTCSLFLTPFRCCSPLTVTVKFQFSEHNHFDPFPLPILWVAKVRIRWNPPLKKNQGSESQCRVVLVAIWWSWMIAYLDLTDSWQLFPCAAVGTLVAQARLHLVLEGGGAGWVDGWTRQMARDWGILRLHPSRWSDD